MAAGSHGADSIPVSKDLQEGYWIRDVGEVGVTVETGAEVRPYIPCGVGCCMSGVGDTSGRNCLDSAQFTAEIMSLGGVYSFQEGCIGNLCCM